jgi:hypothetical protein
MRQVTPSDFSRDAKRHSCGGISSGRFGVPPTCWRRASSPLTREGGHVPSSQNKPEAADERKRSVPACFPRTRLQQGDLLAEIVQDRRDPAHVFECVVQRRGCSEILFLGQFHSQLQAEAAAEVFLADYRARQLPLTGKIPRDGDK